MSHYNNEQKSILLTNLWLSNYAGSELNCLNLATVLSGMGYYVEVATLEFGPPLAEEFHKLNIPAKKILTEDLTRSHYDIIWAHHSIVLDYLLFTKKISADYIVASSLSPFEPFEVLPNYANELSICLANSEETKAKLLSEGSEENKVVVFPNYVDSSWLTYKQRTACSPSPKNIAVVSNHVPEEILQAKTLLNDMGCAVDIYGLRHTFVKITPEILDKYDVIITIGKTVQFAMALKIPVYCYDVHGGPGYIKKDDFHNAAYYNFSGRGFSKKDAAIIANEIIDGYAEQLPTLSEYHKFIQQTSVLENNLHNVLELIKSSPVDCEKLRSEHHWSLRNNSALINLFSFRTETFRLQEDRQNILNEYHELITKEQLLQRELNTVNNRLHTVTAERDDFSNQLNAIFHSRFWKLRNFIRRYIK